jgi:hypothetical protein
MPESPITADNRKKIMQKRNTNLNFFFTQHQLNVVRDTKLTLWILL